MEIHGTGGAEWCDQFGVGFAMLGGLEEPGVYPLGSKIPGTVARDKLFHAASSRFKSERGGADASAPKLRKEALVQVARG